MQKHKVVSLVGTWLVRSINRSTTRYILRSSSTMHLHHDGAAPPPSSVDKQRIDRVTRLPPTKSIVVSEFALFRLEEGGNVALVNAIPVIACQSPVFVSARTDSVLSLDTHTLPHLLSFNSTSLHPRDSSGREKE